MIIDWLFRNKPLPLTDPNSLKNSFLYNAPSDSGVNVNQDTALQYSAVYACIRLLSDTLAQLPLNVYKRENQTSRIDKNNIIYKLLHNKPNDFMTSYTLRNVVMGHCVGWGNGYIYIIRDQLNMPEALMPLLPAVTYPELKENNLVYFTEFNGIQYQLPANDVIHIKGLSVDGLQGLSPISLHRQTVGLSMAGQKFAAKMFGSGSMLSGILQHPGTLRRDPANPNDPSPVDKLRKQWRELYSGLDNAGAVAVLEEGMKFQQTSINPVDAQYMELMKFQISDIARIFNVPSHLINDLDRATFNNISELSLSFARYNIMPWAVNWEQELNSKLFSNDDKHYIKFNIQGLLRGTLEERKEYYKSAIEYGWLNRNEVREKEDLNPVNGLDDYLRPLNLAEQSKANEQGLTN